MPDSDHVVIAGETYEIVRSQRVRAWQRSIRPSQPTDPSELLIAEWDLSGPIGNSREDIHGGALGHDWSDDLDTRFRQLLLPATFRTSVDQTSLDTAGLSTSAALGGFALGSAPLGGGTSAYAATAVTHIDEDSGQIFTHRGAFTTQNTITSTGIPVVVETVIHSATVKEAAPWRGKGRLAFGPAAPVKTRTAVTSSGSTYTEETNVSIGGVGSSTLYARAIVSGNDRAWLARSNPSGTSDNQAFYVLDDFDTFSNSFPVGSGFHNVNGIGSLGPFTVFGMEDGLYGFTDFGKPVLLDDLSQAISPLNGHSFTRFRGWLYYRTRDGLKAWNGGGLISDVGIETMKDYEGSINGRPTALGKAKDFLVAAYRTEDDTQTYIVLGLPNENTPNSGKLDWYPFATIISGRDVEVIHGSGLATTPILYWGEAQRLAYARFRRGSRDIDSSSYTYDVGGGTWYGTTLMRHPHLRKSLRLARWITEGHDRLNSSKLEVQFDDSGTWYQVGQTVQTNGLQTVRPLNADAPADWFVGTRVKPRLTLTPDTATNPATVVPKIRGTLQMVFDERPDQIEEHIFQIKPKTPEQREKLFRLAEPTVDGLHGMNPEEFYKPGSNAREFAHVKSVSETDLGGGEVGIAIQLLQWDVDDYHA